MLVGVEVEVVYLIIGLDIEFDLLAREGADSTQYRVSVCYVYEVDQLSWV